ncbi:hypothetical protein AIOL_003472 [Candidatus Rhodobacter oscarellae]|uniref:Uncharacterized protein n=1 Tax=Candidatus Rhodobacter oscarellae TaxID=1675527 RepID=A0A0J9E726_9RHOB|nr:hypothetical protein [Candidatus Rhodobacter lobularis]KMW58497.1 hypothetical protein AIOL_003472 [Candidatus Rhodobacter lobularis]
MRWIAALLIMAGRGLMSLGHNQARFVVDKGLTELSEHAVHPFQRMVAQALDVEIAP